MTWKLGQIWSKREFQWKVVSVEGKHAVLQSVFSPWARTEPIPIDEWLADGWTLKP